MTTLEHWCEQEHDKAIYALAFNPEGTLLVSGDYQGGMCLWNTRTGTLLSKLQNSTEGYAHSIFALAFNPDSSVLASGRGGIQLWNITMRTQFFADQTEEIASLAWKPDGTMFACGTDSITVRDGQNGEIRHVLKGATDRIISLAWSSDGRLLAAGSDMEDGRIFVWEVAAETLLAVTAVDARYLVFEKDSNLLFTGGYGQLLRWDIKTDRTETLFNAQTKDYPTTFSRDGRLIIYETGGAVSKESSEQNRIHVGEVVSGRELARIESEHSELTYMVLSEDNRLLATADANGNVCVWTLASVE